jgi:hypothetical protein
MQMASRLGFAANRAKSLFDGAATPDGPLTD